MFVIVLFIGILFLIMANKASKLPKQCEKIHKWKVRLDTSDGKGYLQCSVCQKFPGED